MCTLEYKGEKSGRVSGTRSDVSSVSMIPAVSIKSEMVFVCGWNDASGWEVTGLDWKSGATRHRSILGKNNRANVPTPSFSILLTATFYSTLLPDQSA